VDRLASITALEAELQQIPSPARGRESGRGPSADLGLRAKRAGFDDARIGELSGGRMPTTALEPTFRQVDTCAAEFEAVTPYYYATYEDEDEIIRSGNTAVAVIGSGPIRIGQGIEFDYCSVHASAALQEAACGSATNAAAALGIFGKVGYPVLVRPTYVLGVRGMEIVHSAPDLRRYVEAAMRFGVRGPILVDKYLLGRELDVDAVCDGETVLIPGILEHIERAGIHSGDSFAVYPPLTLTPAETDRVVEATTTIARLFKPVALINIQFVIKDGIPYVLEVNPRASRTVPFLSKVTGVPMVNLATHAALGRPLVELGFVGGLQPSRSLYAVKAPVFSMAKLPAVDAVLGPEMKSTGEAMGIAKDLPTAQYKAFLSTMQELPPDGAALCSIADADKEEALPILQA